MRTKLATNIMITAKDHSAVQINIGKLDDTGRFVSTLCSP